MYGEGTTLTDLCLCATSSILGSSDVGEDSTRYPLGTGRMRAIIVVVSLVAIVAGAPSPAVVTDTSPLIHRVERIARMRCCNCYINRSNGTRFFEGVREMGFCHSIGGTCEGEVPCGVQ